MKLQDLSWEHRGGAVSELSAVMLLPWVFCLDTGVIRPELITWKRCLQTLGWTHGLISFPLFVLHFYLLVWFTCSFAMTMSANPRSGMDFGVMVFVTEATCCSLSSLEWGSTKSTAKALYFGFSDGDKPLDVPSPATGTLGSRSDLMV